MTPPAIHRHASLGSTNDEAMRLAREGHAGHVWVVADRQTGGRGRHGRVWASPPGNLHASLLLLDPAPVPQLPELGFVAGVALADALRAMLDGDTGLRIKWPNDMLYKGAKLAGLMLEGSQLPGGDFACVIGIGVNCAVHPEGLAYRVTSLSAAAGRDIACGHVLEQVVRHMKMRLEQYDSGRNFAAIRQAWTQMAAGIGESIAIGLGDAQISGTFNGIDDCGRLVLTTSEGMRTISAGDVFLTAAHSADSLRQIQSPETPILF